MWLHFSTFNVEQIIVINREAQKVMQNFYTELLEEQIKTVVWYLEQ